MKNYAIGIDMGVKCTVTNDANAAAQGEMIYGAARGMKNFIVITLGTGGRFGYCHRRQTAVRS